MINMACCIQHGLLKSFRCDFAWPIPSCKITNIKTVCPFHGEGDAPTSGPALIVLAANDSRTNTSFCALRWNQRYWFAHSHLSLTDRYRHSTKDGRIIVDGQWINLLRFCGWDDAFSNGG